MLIVKIDKGLDKALKIWKGKVRKTKQNEEIRKRKQYIKKSVKRREEILKAKYVEEKFKDD